MKEIPLNFNAERPDVLRAKLNYGMWYGIILGLSFAIFCWGIDGYVLSNNHGMQPWLKFIIGTLICVPLGGIFGRYAAKLGNPIYATLLWIAVAFGFAWLTVNLPLRILPNALYIIAPQTQNLLHYEYYKELGSHLAVAYIWLVIFIALAGIIQLPLTDSSVFSTTFFGRLGPFLVLFILMGIAGTIVDNGLVNAPLRSAILSTDTTIQFVIDNRGKEVDRDLARRMHSGAFRAVEDSVTSQRELVVSGYDGLLGEISILVRFEEDWVDCLILYNQPSLCSVVAPTP